MFDAKPARQLQASSCSVARYIARVGCGSLHLLVATIVLHPEDCGDKDSTLRARRALLSGHQTVASAAVATWAPVLVALLGPAQCDGVAAADRRLAAFLLVRRHEHSHGLAAAGGHVSERESLARGETPATMATVTRVASFHWMLQRTPLARGSDLKSSPWTLVAWYGK